MIAILIILLWAFSGFLGWWLAIRNDDTLGAEDIIALALAVVIGPFMILIVSITGLIASKKRFRNPFK